MTLETAERLHEALRQEQQIIEAMCSSESALHGLLIAVKSAEISEQCRQQDRRVLRHGEIRKVRDLCLIELGHNKAPVDVDHLEARLGSTLGPIVCEQIDSIQNRQAQLIELRERSRDLATQGLALISRLQAAPQPKLYRLRGGRIEGTAA